MLIKFQLSIFKLKVLELKLSKPHFIKFEVSPKLRFALHSSQLVQCMYFSAKNCLSPFTRGCIFSESYIFRARNT